METRIWQKSSAPLETRQADPLQTAGRHQENGGAGYDAALNSLLAAEGTSTALSTLRYTTEGETFLRYESADAAFSHITPSGVTPRTFAAPVSDGLVPLEQRVSTYNLPNPEIPRPNVFTLRPPAGTPVIGPRPVMGGPGNEVLFPYGY